MWYTYTMEYYSAIKRNKIELFVVRWMDLESVIQSDSKSEREKQIPYANTYIWNLKKKKRVLMNLGTGQEKDTDVRMDLRTWGGVRVSWDKVIE